MLVTDRGIEIATGQATWAELTAAATQEDTDTAWTYRRILAEAAATGHAEAVRVRDEADSYWRDISRAREDAEARGDAARRARETAEIADERLATGGAPETVGICTQSAGGIAVVTLGCSLKRVAMICALVRNRPRLDRLRSLQT